MTTQKLAFNDADWDKICDAHCHPHDDVYNLEAIAKLKTGRVTIMGTKEADWNVVLRVVEICQEAGCPEKPIPCFGIHPWYAHLIQSPQQYFTPSSNAHYASILTSKKPADLDLLLPTLPAPTPFLVWSQLLRQHLIDHPTALVGEIGIDKSSRLLPPGSDHWHGVIPTTVQCIMNHQIQIFGYQVDLARELGRACSVHCVQGYGQLLEFLQTKIKEWGKNEKLADGRRKRGDNKEQEHEATIQRSLVHGEADGEVEGEVKGVVEGEVRHAGKDWLAISRSLRPLRLCVHSYGGSKEMLLSLYKLPHHNLEIFVSFSIAINGRLGDRLSELIRSVPEDQLLIESDIDTPLVLDDKMYEIVEKVADAKGWTMMEVVERTERNWRRFVSVPIDG